MPIRYSFPVTDMRGIFGTFEAGGKGSQTQTSAIDDKLYSDVSSSKDYDEAMKAVELYEKLIEEGKQNEERKGNAGASIGVRQEDL